MHLLRSMWAEPRPPLPPAPRWQDWALVALFATTSLLEGALRAVLPWRAGSVALAIVLLPTLLWRRTRPLAAVAVALVAVSVVPQVVGGAPVELYSLAYVLILAYALGRFGSGREVVTGAAIIVASAGLAAALRPGTVSDAVGGVAIPLSAVTLGAALRWRDRARSRELDQVRERERERLARDLHDTVAHHVSAMAIRAQAGIAVAAHHPDAATDALRVIEAEASRALTEMRAMVRILRHGRPADPAPQPRIADLGQLAGRGDHGPPVEVAIAGELDGLSPAVSTAIYRLAQESVTNAQRHARHATRIRVSVAADDTSVRLRVTDDGDPGPGRAGWTPGYGLIGMAERAGLLGGTCEAGPGEGRGWTVDATLPRTGSPA